MSDYRSLVSECDTLNSFYADIVPDLSLTFTDINNGWTIIWSYTNLANELRWKLTFTALQNLPFVRLLVLGGTTSNNGGLGDGPPPSNSSSLSYANFIEVSDVSGVSLNPPVNYQTSSAINVANGNTFNAGATFSVSFTVPNGLSNHLAYAAPGGPAVNSGVNPAGIFETPRISMALVRVCTPFEPVETPPDFVLEWAKRGSKIYESGVDRGVLYFDDGRVVPWNGLVSVGENFGRSSNSVYFDGSKLSEVTSIEGFSANVTAITYPKQLEGAYGNKSLRQGVYLGGQTPRSFGFSYRTRLGTDLDQDAGYKIHIVYNILAMPEDRTYSTISNEPEVTEFNWTFLTTPERATNYRASAYVVLNSLKIAPNLLTEVESILYGTFETLPYLPSLDDLLALFATFSNYINITDNGDGTWTAETQVEGIITSFGGIAQIRDANIQPTGTSTYFISSTPDPPD